MEERDRVGRRDDDDDDDVEGLRRVGRERLGGRRWRRRERVSMAESDVEEREDCVDDGVGGGADVGPPYRWLRW